MGGGCGCKQQGSSRGSPNCPSPPPAAAATGGGAAAWELLYAAAGEVAKMRSIEEEATAVKGYNRAQYGVPQKPCPISSVPFHHHQLQANQVS